MLSDHSKLGLGGSLTFRMQGFRGLYPASVNFSNVDTKAGHHECNSDPVSYNKVNKTKQILKRLHIA